MNVHVYTYQKDIMYMLFIIFLCISLYWLLMSLGIDFGSMLAPLWHQTPCVFATVFSFLNCMFIDLDPKVASKNRQRYPLFSSLFRNGCF